MKSVCCLVLLICHIELEFQKSTAVNLRNPLRSLWLSIGRAQPIGAWRENAGAASLFIQASLLLLFGIVECSCRWNGLQVCEARFLLHTRQNALEFQPVLTVARRLPKVKVS